MRLETMIDDEPQQEQTRLIDVIRQYSETPVESVKVTLACHHTHNSETELDVQVGDTLICNKCHCSQNVVLAHFTHQQKEKS